MQGVLKEVRCPKCDKKIVETGSINIVIKAVCHRCKNHFTYAN